MRKRFLILVAIFSIILVIGAGTITFYINQAINNLDELVARYQKERNCTKILMAIKNVQHDGFLHHTYKENEVNEMNERVSTMEKMAATCYSCHHSPDVQKKIDSLALQTDNYKKVLTTIFVDQDNPLHNSVDLQAFAMGQDLYEYARSIFKKSSKQLAVESQTVRELSIKSKYLIYITVFGGLVIMIFAAIMLMQCFTKPLQGLLAATENIKRGDLDSRVSGLKYEFGTLADSFNNMAASLQTQMIQLQQSEQLAACGKIATTLVHEVKNPLAGIKVAMEVLAGESSVSAEDKKILQKVVKEVNLIDSLLSNMLEFARPKPPQLTNIRLNDVVERALRFTPGVLKKHILVDWEKEEQLPDIRTDPDQLNQVLLNLFINAEAAMPQGGTIFISTSGTEREIRLCIADNGPGISRDDLHKIFTPFFTTKAKGTGLGLTTCRTLITLLDGKIECNNRPEGGAQFTITLPLAGDGTI